MSAAHSNRDSDRELMRLALGEAERAAEHGDVPIGAVVAKDGEVLAAAGNERELRADPTAHAEVLALRAAAERLGGWRIPGATIYVTLEPCAMCAMALMHARFKRVVFAARDPKTGVAGSVIDLFGQAQLNHHTAVEGGLMADASSQLLRDFFNERREAARARRAERAGLIPTGEATHLDDT
jgi:tRNA(adenine34) deaminase